MFDKREALCSVQREPCFNFRDGIENICLSISCPRRDREFLSSGLTLRDEIEIFFLSISCFETSTRIFFFQSRASRRAREFFHLISGFEMRARNSVISSQFLRRERDFEDEEVYPWFLLRNPHFTWWFSFPLLSVCNSFLFFFMKVKVVYLRVQPMLS